MARVLEPELMCGENATLYADAPFEAVNRAFCDQLCAAFPELVDAATLLDVGCGPGDIGILLVERAARLRATLLDGSEDMLRFAADRVRRAGVDDRVVLSLGLVPTAALPHAHFEFVVSNGFVHHLPEPAKLWPWARTLLAPGGALWIRDLRRPETPEEARRLVDLHMPGADETSAADFYHSLRAALTVEEVRADLDAAGLRNVRVEANDDRYWIAYGRP